jgi:hypothetical protein
MTLNLQQTEVERQFDSPFLQFVARSEQIKRSSGTTKTKCLKIGHFWRFPQVDSHPFKVASSHSVSIHSFPQFRKLAGVFGSAHVLYGFGPSTSTATHLEASLRAR